MKLIRTYLKPFWPILLLSLFLAGINQIFSLLDPQVFRWIVDNYVTKASELTRAEFLYGIYWGVGGLIGVAMISRIAKNIQDYFTNVMSQKLGMKMYQDTIQHAFNLPYMVFEDQFSGQLLGKLQKARNDFQNLILQVINVVFVSLVGIIFVLFYAYSVHRLVGVLYTSLLPLMGILMTMMSRTIKKASEKIAQESAAVAGTTTESLRNVSLIKSLGLEQQEIDRLGDANEIILGLEIKKLKIVRTLEFLQGTLVNACRVSLLGIMFWLVFEQSITLGQFLTLFFYSFYIFSPLYQFGTVVKTYQESRASLDVLHQVLDLKPVILPLNPVTIDHVQSIAFKNVNFSYDGTRTVLENISLQINKSQTIAFVGPSGGGKSTILKLLLGLYEATSGEILRNGTSVSQLHPDFKKKIGLVTQETQLFSGTIRDNLLFVKPEATDEECRSVLEDARIDTLFRTQRDGLGTMIGEAGIKLSGGQRQRLAIARALLRNPELLIFDEATSALDSIVEKEITETIKEIPSQQDVTTILVAHRLSTIMHADTIYVLENGKICEQGTHNELVANHGLYSALRRQQSGEEVVA